MLLKRLRKILIAALCFCFQFAHGYMLSVPHNKWSKNIDLFDNGNHIVIPQQVPRPINVEIGEMAYAFASNAANILTNPIPQNVTQKNLPITQALQQIQSNMDRLDSVVNRTPQLTRAELLVLISTVFVSACSPFLLNLNVVEVLVPSMAAIAASIGISAEYTGKVAVASSKEVAALAIQAAAEAEVILASSERAKALLPLCVGIATTASAFALLAPNLCTELNQKLSVQVVTEIYLLCPLIAVLAAAVAGLATQEAIGLANRAAGLGARRFASAGTVGRTWLSATEQVEQSSMRQNQKWKSFVLGVTLAPLIASSCPGALAFKAIVCAAIASAQAAYYLSMAEYYVSSAMETVALKARASAVADTYANQCSRAGALLPFTSALAGLCAAASAAAVELLPLVSAAEIQSLISLTFPTGAALFAAAASVAKARCEVDACAASTAASSGLTGNGSLNSKDPIRSVLEQIKISVETSWNRIVTRIKQVKNIVTRGYLRKTISKWFRNSYKRLWRQGNT